MHKQKGRYYLLGSSWGLLCSGSLAMFFFLVGRGDLAGRAGARPKEMLWARPLDVLGGSRLMWRAARRGLLSWPVVRRMVYVHVCVGPRAERRGGPLR